MSEVNRIRDDKEALNRAVDLIWSGISSAYEEPKGDTPEIVGLMQNYTRDYLSGRRPEIRRESRMFGLRVYMDIMDIRIPNTPDDDLRRLVYRAEDTYGIDLELIQQQLARQIEIVEEAGREGNFGDWGTLDRAMREGHRLGFFKTEETENL
ncbi:MAG TPA: hypothetical protein VG965_00070 [Patescibacteria group bacterium]|nr:hypothetical protein [Patescibacteria group bacterium]